MCKHQLETEKNQSQRKKNRNQHSDTPHPCPRTDVKDQDDTDLADLNIRVTKADANLWDMVTDPSPNPQTQMDCSDDSVGLMSNSGRQMSHSVTLDKQGSDMVRRGMLSQALLTSIRSRRSSIDSINSGSDMNPDVVNIIDDTLTRAATVINTVADVGSLGSGSLNWSSCDDVC